MRARAKGGAKLDSLATFPQFDSFTLNAIFRLAVAALFGGALGFERMMKMRAASIRTYSLVCVGSAMTILTSVYISNYLNVSIDVSRISAQVISGIGFIGAGTIMVSGYHRVNGITTAAGLWVSASMGLAIGSGFIVGGLAMLLITLFILSVVGKYQMSYKRRSKYLSIYVLFNDVERISSFLQALTETGLYLCDFEMKQPIGNCVGANFSLKILNHQTHKEAVDRLKSQEGIAFIEEF